MKNGGNRNASAKIKPAARGSVTAALSFHLDTLTLAAPEVLTVHIGFVISLQVSRART